MGKGVDEGSSADDFWMNMISMNQQFNKGIPARSS